MKRFLQILFISIPTWLGFWALVFVPTLLLGWVLVPIAAACGAYIKTDDNLDKPADGPIYHFTWKFMYLWDNWEDGIANKNYWVAPNMFLQIVYWSCVRNPANNLRLVPLLSVKIDPFNVRFIGTFGSRLAVLDYLAYRVINNFKAAGLPITDESEVFINNLKKYDTKVPHWFFAWQGIYSNFYWQFNLFGKLRRFWIGWKIYPTDILGGPYGYRKKGAGFALQLKVVK